MLEGRQGLNWRLLLRFFTGEGQPAAGMAAHGSHVATWFTHVAASREAQLLIALMRSHPLTTVHCGSPLQAGWPLSWLRPSRQRPSLRRVRRQGLQRVASLWAAANSLLHAVQNACARSVGPCKAAVLPASPCLCSCRHAGTCPTPAAQTAPSLCSAHPTRRHLLSQQQHCGQAVPNRCVPAEHNSCHLRGGCLLPLAGGWLCCTPGQRSCKAVQAVGSHSRPSSLLIALSSGAECWRCTGTAATLAVWDLSCRLAHP